MGNIQVHSNGSVGSELYRKIGERFERLANVLGWKWGHPLYLELRRFMMDESNDHLSDDEILIKFQKEQDRERRLERLSNILGWKWGHPLYLELRCFMMDESNDHLSDDEILIKFQKAEQDYKMRKGRLERLSNILGWKWGHPLYWELRCFMMDESNDHLSDNEILVKFQKAEQDLKMRERLERLSNSLNWKWDHPLYQELMNFRLKESSDDLSDNEILHKFLVAAQDTQDRMSLEKKSIFKKALAKFAHQEVEGQVALPNQSKNLPLEMPSSRHSIDDEVYKHIDDDDNRSRTGAHFRHDDSFTIDEGFRHREFNRPSDNGYIPDGSEGKSASFLNTGAIPKTGNQGAKIHNPQRLAGLLPNHGPPRNEFFSNGSIKSQMTSPKRFPEHADNCHLPFVETPSIGSSFNLAGPVQEDRADHLSNKHFKLDLQLPHGLQHQYDFQLNDGLVCLQPIDCLPPNEFLSKGSIKSQTGSPKHFPVNAGASYQPLDDTNSIESRSNLSGTVQEDGPDHLFHKQLKSDLQHDLQQTQGPEHSQSLLQPHVAIEMGAMVDVSTNSQKNFSEAFAMLVQEKNVTHQSVINCFINHFIKEQLLPWFDQQGGWTLVLGGVLNLIRSFGFNGFTVICTAVQVSWFMFKLFF